MVAEQKKKVGKRTGVEMVAYTNGIAAAREVMYVEKDKLFRLSLNNDELDPPLELLQFEARKGDKWSREFTFMSTKVKTDFSVFVEKVEVPFGKYRTAKLVRADADDGTNKITSDVWYVSGVGMVKQKVTLGGNPLVELELSKFEKGDK
jgi:hypothetical protein